MIDVIFKEVSKKETMNFVSKMTCDVCGAEVQPDIPNDYKHGEYAEGSYIEVEVPYYNGRYEQVDYFQLCCPECARVFLERFFEKNKGKKGIYGFEMRHRDSFIPNGGNKIWNRKV